MKNVYIKIGILFIVIISLLVTFYVFNSDGLSKYAKKLNIDENIDKLIGVTILENIDDIKKYSLNNIDIYENVGEELYLVIPIYKNVTMNIYTAVMEEDNIVKEKLIATTNKPYILKCNVSDIIPNIIIEIKQNNKIYNYSPSISLKDGSLYVNEYVMDINNK